MNKDIIYSICSLLIICLVWYMIYKTSGSIRKQQPLQCRKSTISNPMMNPMPFEDHSLVEACKESSKTIQDNLNHGFLQDQNDEVQLEKNNMFYD